ncbi:MAG TPA: hypothetical protein VMP11_03380 [Verrucomicrobiae bacterium]|nr:hypothetical protein [Verrucomicrobiae bacterium]
MSAAKQMKLVGSSGGRVLLHLFALAQDHRVRWHWAGIVRELHLGGRS